MPARTPRRWADNRAVDERSERREGLQHVTAAGLPRGAPARLRQVARLAAVRALLGDDLGRHLVGLREEPERVVLLLAGDGWERGLAPHLDGLAEPLARALEAAVRPIGVESVPAAPGEPGPAPVPAAGAGGAAPCSTDPGAWRLRLEAVAQRLLARSQAREGGGTAGTSIDRGPAGR